MAVTVTVGCFTSSKHHFQQTLAARLFHKEDDDDMMEEEPFPRQAWVLYQPSLIDQADGLLAWYWRGTDFGYNQEEVDKLSC